MVVLEVDQEEGFSHPNTDNLIVRHWIFWVLNGIERCADMLLCCLLQ